MNNTCKVIWSHVHRQMVVVSEAVSAQGKAQSTKVARAPASANGAARRKASACWTPTHLASALALAFGALVVGVSAMAQTLPSVAHNALPTNGSVVAGGATIHQSGASMVIDQSSQRAVLNWQSFTVGQEAHVHFNNAGGSTLNRVTGTEASIILGRITAPGQVIISNGNGVFFGRGSRVDVGSLIGTTHSIGDDRFMTGDMIFERNGATGSVVNEGELRAKLEGYIALMAPEVRNQGLIIATMGTVAMAAGEVVELQLNPNNKLTNIRVEAGQWRALVENKQAIEAGGGLVILNAMTARELQGSVVNNSGSINANSLTSQGGRIILTGDHITLNEGSSITATGNTGGGQVLVGGDWQGGANAQRRIFDDPNALHQASTVTVEAGATIDASAIDNGKGGTVVLWSDVSSPNSVTRVSGRIDAKGGQYGGDGGQIETSGGLLITGGVTGSAAAPKGKAGEWLFDPYNIEIVSANGDTNGSFNSGSWTATGNDSKILNTSINDLLSSGTSVTVSTAGAGVQAGNISVNAPITSSATTGNTQLAMLADGGIYVNADITTRGDLFLKANNAIDFGGSTNVQTNGGNIVLWSSANGGFGGYIRSSTFNTNGGHVWIGGSGMGAGDRTWNGLTVGAGYSAESNNAAVALRGNITTAGGDVFIAGESGNGNKGDIEAEGGNRTISAGSGDITLMPFSEQLQSIGSNSLLILETGGKISVAPISGGSFWSGQTRTYNGSVSSGTFNGSSALAGLQIANFADITGLELGTYSGTGLGSDTAYIDANVKNMQIDATLNVAGPIRIFGNQIGINSNIQSTAEGSDITVRSQGIGTGNDNGYISIQPGVSLTTQGGDIVLWSNAANRTSGLANNEIWIGGTNTFTSNGGKIVLAGGLDDGSRGEVSGDGIPDGYAYRGNNSEPAVKVGANVNLLAGGGDVIIRGQQNGTDIAIATASSFTISNAGAVTIEGKNTSAQKSVHLGTSNIAATGNITLTGDWLQTDSVNITTTGSLTVQPLSDSFTSALTWPLSGLTLGNDLSGLTLGKSTNTSDITISDSQTIGGPISIYGRDIFVNGNLNTSAGGAAGDVLLKATRDLSVRSVTTAGGDVGLLADSDNDGLGASVVAGSVSVGNGGITLSGVGTVFNGSSAQTLSTVGTNINFGGEVIIANPNGLTINSGGGDVNFATSVNSGNSYVHNNTLRTWNDAKATFNGGSAEGAQYLATVTSALELSQVMAAAGGNSAWLGGSDLAQEGVWRWVTGPEGLENNGVGRIFWNAGAAPGPNGVTGYVGYQGNFVNWNQDEPNNLNGGEHGLQIGFGQRGQWNDLRVIIENQGSIVETNLSPSALTINAGTGKVAFGGAVGSSKELASLTVNSGLAEINGGLVSTTGAQTYNAPVVLGADTTFTTRQKDIVFNSTVNSTLGHNWNLTANILPSSTYHWVDWTSADATNVYGNVTIDGEVINVTYSNQSGQLNNGKAYEFAQLDSGVNYWTGQNGAGFSGASPYVSAQVANGPTGPDIIALRFAGSQTLTFEKPVENLAFSVVSLNGNGFEFNQNFDIVSYTGLNGAGPGYWGSGPLVKEQVNGAYQLNDAGGVGSEPHGTIRFNKSFSELTWKSQSNEVWSGFTVGITGTSDTAGVVRFNGAVGGDAPLGAMEVNAKLVTGSTASVNAGSLAVSGLSSLGNSITTGGNQSFSSAVTLTNDVVLKTTANNGSVSTASETSPIDGAYKLAIETHGTGGATLKGAVGGTTEITELRIDSAGDVALTAVTAEGPIAVAGADVSLDGTLDSSAGNGDLTLTSSSAISLSKAVSLLSGSGDLTLTTPRINGAQFGGNYANGKMTVSTTGTFSLLPYSTTFDGYFMAGNLVTPSSQLDLVGSFNGDTFTGTNEASWLVVNAVSGLKGLTVGKEGTTSSIATYTPWAINGPIRFYGANITLGEGLDSTTGAADGDVLLKASSNIALASGKTISTAGGDVILWADSDASGSETLAGGGILLGNAASIGTSGGRIVLAGGADTLLADGQTNGTDGIPDGYARAAELTTSRGLTGPVTAAVALDNASLNAGTGGVLIRGQGTGNGGRHQMGVRLYGGSITGGDVSISGLGSVNAASAGHYGVSLEGFSITSNGAVSLYGKGGAANGGNNDTDQVGVFLRAAADNATDGSTVTVTDIVDNSDPQNPVVTKTGSISITGEGGAGQVAADAFGQNSSLVINATGVDMGAILSAQRGAISINGTSGFNGLGDAVVVSGEITTSLSGNVSVNGNGSVTGTSNSPAHLGLGGEVKLNASITLQDTSTVSPVAGGRISLNAAGKITQSAALSASELLVTADNVELNHTSNSVSTLAASGVGDFSYVNAEALTIGTVGGTSGIDAGNGEINVVTQAGNLTLSQDVVTANAGTSALTLNAGASTAAGTSTGGNLLVTGTPIISVGSGGRTRLFTGSLAGSIGVATLGSSGNYRYNADEGTDFSSVGWTDLSVSGTHVIYREQPNATISSMTLSMTYGDALPTVNATGTVNGDESSYDIAGASFSNGRLQANASPYDIRSTLVGLGYSVSGPSNGTLTVGAKELTISGFAAANKVYDGTNVATITSGGILDGVISGDTVTVSNGGATFDNKNAGTAKTVTLNNLMLGGGDAGNYRLDSAVATTSSIAPKTVTLSGTKIYDGATSLTGGHVTISTGVGGETLSYSNATAASRHVGGADNDMATADNHITAITLTDATDASGGLASNYQLPDLTAPAIGVNTVTITPATLTPTLASSDVRKVYDGTTHAPVTFSPIYSFAGLVPGDNAASLSASAASYNNPNVNGATSITVSGLTINGIAGANGSHPSDYALDATSKQLAAIITPALLKVTTNDDAKFVTQADPIGFAGVSYSGFVNGETNSQIGGTLTIIRNNGSTTAGTYTGALMASGLIASNYDIAYVPGNFTIVPSNQLLVRVANANTTYGTVTQYTIGSVEYYDGTSVVRLDNRSVTGSAVAIDSENAVTINDGSAGTARFKLAPQFAHTTGSGNLAVGTYQLSTSGTVTENSANFSDTIAVVGAHQVNSLGLTASGSNVNKVYDGTTAMQGVTLDLNTPKAGDEVTVYGKGAFASKNVGTGLAYTISDLALAGSDAANYHLNGDRSLSGSDGTITARTLTVDYTGVDKVYDGSNIATVHTNDDRVSGDTLIIHRNATFTDKNVGVGKAVAIADVILSGIDAGNYTVADSGSASATITRLSTVSWIGGNSGNWFDPANWAGGAVPDLSNVANVQIPVGVTVTFNNTALGAAVAASTKESAVSVDSLGNAGSLQQDAGFLNIGSSGMTLAGYTQNGGVLTNVGTTVLGSFAQTSGSFNGTGDFNSNHFSQSGGDTALEGNLTVRQDFVQGGGSKVTVGGNTRITDNSGGTTIGNLDSTGTTTVLSSNGAIAQAAGTTMTLRDVASFTASNGNAPAKLYDITLDETSNDFQSTGTFVGNNIIVGDKNELDVAVTAGGNLSLKAGGSLAAVLVVSGDSTLTSVRDLTVQGNTGNLTTTTTGSNSSTTFGATTVHGNLSTSSTGHVGQSGSLSVNGTTNFIATGRSVTLIDAGNNFIGSVSGTVATMNLHDINALTLGTVTTTGDLTVKSSGAISLGTSTVGGNLNVNTGNGDISQGGSLVVRGTSILNAGIADVTLDESSNDFMGTVAAQARSLTLHDANNVKFDQVTVARNLRVTAGGSILQDTSRGQFMTAAGTTALRAVGMVNLPGDNLFTNGVLAQASEVTVRGDVLGDAQEAAAAGAAAATAAAGGLPLVMNDPAPAVTGGIDSLGSSSSANKGPASAGASTPGILTELQQLPQSTQVGVVAVSLPPETAIAGSGFVFVLPPDVVEQLTPEVHATLADGAVLPSWLRFNQTTGEFTATAVPDQAFPIQVSLTLGTRQWLVVISERTTP